MKGATAALIKSGRSAKNEFAYMNIYFIDIIFATSGIFFDICTLLVNEIQCTELFTRQT